MLSLLRVIPLLAYCSLCAACPETWYNVEDIKCVKFFPRLEHEAGAVNRCEQNGASLLVIENKQEWRAISFLTALHDYKNSWTGDNATRFFSQRGGPCSLTTGDVDQVCRVYVYDNNKVNRCDVECNKLFPFACQKPYEDTGLVRPLPVTGYECPPKFTSWGKNCYHFLAERHNSPDECRSKYDEGGLVVESKFEEDFIRITMANLGYGLESKLWLNASCTDQTCTYLSNETLVSHDRLNLTSCTGVGGTNVYWDLITDEWRCADKQDPDAGFYSICKVAGQRKYGVEVVAPVLPSLIAAEQKDGTSAASSFLSSSSSSSYFLLIFIASRFLQP
ncbi:hypothetical protein HDE_06067 [Halotydeus destructor]|nr:hypothetical protein HDE_06067 [Halotydeus destructor]